jgi:hypothetical protein
MHLRVYPFATPTPTAVRLPAQSEAYIRALGTSVPLPSVLSNHIRLPRLPLREKVTGFRIEVKGRMGSRSRRDVVQYGKFGFSRSAGVKGSMVDFARGLYITKRGTTGVKVYVAYGTPNQ